MATKKTAQHNENYGWIKGNFVPVFDRTENNAM